MKEHDKTEKNIQTYVRVTSRRNLLFDVEAWWGKLRSGALRQRTRGSSGAKIMARSSDGETMGEHQRGDQGGGAPARRPRGSIHENSCLVCGNGHIQQQ